MRLEDEIKQKKFQHVYQKLMINIIYTGGWVKRINTSYFKDFGLTTQQFNVLRILRGQHPNSASVELITDRMIDKLSNATRLVERLRLKGYVDWNKDITEEEVYITDAGLDLLDEADKQLSSMFDELKRLDEGEAEQLNNLMDKLRG